MVNLPSLAREGDCVLQGLSSHVIAYGLVCEEQTLLWLGVLWCWTCVVSNTDTFNYTQLWDFLKLLVVSVFVLCTMFVSVSVLHRSQQRKTYKIDYFVDKQNKQSRSPLVIYET